MEVIVKTDAIIRHQVEKEVSKPAALARLKEIVDQETVKSTDPWYRSRIDVNQAAKNARMYGKNLDKVVPETLSPAAKDTMWRRAKALKDQFVVGMLSHEELHPVRGFEDHGVMKWVVDEGKMHALRSVERNVAWEKRNSSIVREFKNLMRHLCPGDPNAGDIERFRPKMRGVH